MQKPVVEIYARKDCTLCAFAKKLDCTLCQDAKAIIGRVRDEVPFLFKEIDISNNDDLFRRFKDDIPTVFINGGKAFKFKVDEAEFRKRIRKEFIKAGLKKISDKKQQYS